MASASEIHQLVFCSVPSCVKTGPQLPGRGLFETGPQERWARVELHTQAQMPSAHRNGASHMRANVWCSHKCFAPESKHPPLARKAPLVRVEGLHTRQWSCACMRLPPPPARLERLEAAVLKNTHFFARILRFQLLFLLQPKKNTD